MIGGSEELSIGTAGVVRTFGVLVTTVGVFVTTVGVVFGTTVLAVVGPSHLGLFAPFKQQYLPVPPFSQQSRLLAPFLQQNIPRPPFGH